MATKLRPLGNCCVLMSLIGALLGTTWPAVTSEAAPAGTTVQQWQTSQAGDRLTLKSGLTFAADDTSSLPTIEISPDRQYQAMDGFGGTFNEAGWSVLSTLSAAARNEVITKLFNPTTGAGFSLNRTPMGMSDFSLIEYTYDDLNSGTDFSMSQFSIARDQQYLIPYIQAAKSQGNFRTFTSPWTAPAWMKTNNSLTNGGRVFPPSVDPRYYQAYALYFQKYIQAYAQNNIPIDFIVPQNEPGYPAAFGSTLWTPAEMSDFIANYLGPQLQNNNLGARIRIYEHNRDTWQYPKEVLDNPATLPYVAGVNWHNYDCVATGDVCLADNIKLFAGTHPGYSMWMSEYTTISTAPIQDYLDGEKWGKEIFTDVNNGDGGWIFWNMVLDQNGGPVSPNSGPQDALVMVNTSTGAVSYLAKYWYLAHFSKYVRPGAYRMGADGGQLNDGLYFSAFKNADGSNVLVVMNTNSSAVQIKVREDGNIIKPTLAAHSINTFKWTGPVNTHHIIAGSTGKWNSIGSDPYGPDAYYSGGTAPANTTPAIDNTADDPLYQSERFGNFSYNFPVPNGRYQVALKFSENYWSGSGKRRFHVDAEGSRRLSDFDIYTAAGGRYKAVDRTFVVNVTDGAVSLQFTSVIDSAKIGAIAITPLPTEGSLFTTLSAPGYVMAHDYNTGGEGYAHHFSYVGSTSTYRGDGVNIEPCSNDARCGYNIGWLSDGDYMNYTVNVAVGGNYDLLVRVAAPGNASKFVLEMDGRPVVDVNNASTFTVPSTGGYQFWTTVPVKGVNLSKGTHTFTFKVVTGGFNLHYLFFKKVHRLDASSVIEAEWYAGGGEGEGYHDMTPGNASTNPYPGYYRSEDADIEMSNEHAYNIGHTDDGEWLRYDVYNPTARNYTVTFRVASQVSTAQLRLDLDTIGNTVGGTIAVPNTGGWQRWQNLSQTVTLPAGTHALYVFVPKGGVNLNYITLN